MTPQQLQQAKALLKPEDHYADLQLIPMKNEPNGDSVCADSPMVADFFNVWLRINDADDEHIEEVIDIDFEDESSARAEIETIATALDTDWEYING